MAVAEEHSKAPTNVHALPIRRSATDAGASGGRRRIKSAAFFAIIITGALMLPPTRSGMTEASNTLRER